MGASLPTLKRWRFAAVGIVYLVLVPAALVYVAIDAQSGLRNDRRQDKQLRQQVKVDAKLARTNCERSYALLDYFLAANAMSTAAGEPAAPLVRPLLDRLIDTFNSLDGCPPHPH